MSKEYVFIGNAQNKTRDFINQLIKENKDLQHQLEEKQKIIDKAIEFLKEFHNYKNSFKWCEEDYIQTIIAIEKILERGKNANTTN